MIYAWYVRGQKHAGLCQVSMAAVRLVDPLAECVVATDDEEVDVPEARMVRFPEGLPLMVANLEAQLQVLDSATEQVVFLDTDVILLKPFPMEEAPGLVVTWRDTVGGKIEDVPGGVADAMPYNYGVLSAVPGLRTTEALLWIRERIRKLAPHLQLWWGNQIALASLCGPRPQGGESIETRHIPWQLTFRGMPLRVRKLPGSIWNYTPTDEHEDLCGRGAVHFKGHTRQWMETVVKRMELPWAA